MPAPNITNPQNLSDKFDIYSFDSEYLLDSVNTIIVVLDREGKIVFANSKACEVLKTTKQNIIGKDWFTHFLPNSNRAEVKDYFLKLINSPEYTPKVHENIITDINGSEITTYWFAQLLKNNKGEVVGMISSGQDVSALRQTENKFKIIFDYAPDTLYLLDPDGVILDFNKAGEGLVGYTKKEIIGKNFREVNLLPKQDLLFAIKMLAQNTLGKRTGPNIISFIHKNGSKKQVEITTFPITLNNKRCTLGVARDLSMRKQAQMLDIQEKRFNEAVIESIPGIFYVLDSSGRFVKWNTNLEAITGYTSEEIANMIAVSLFSENEKKLIVTKIDEVFKKGYAEVEAPILTKQGVKIPYYLTGNLVETENNYLVGTGIDVSSLHQAQSQLGNKLKEFESLTNLMVGRELKMIELKKRIKELEGSP